jgi:hypothetical protein
VRTPWGASSYYLEHLLDLIIISLFNLFFGSFDCSLHLLKFIHHVILFCLQSLILNIVWFPSNICLCICARVFTYFFWICTLFWRNSHYIGLLSFFAHFGNGCQWGRSFEGLKGIGLYALVLFLRICLACFASLYVSFHG